MACCFRSCWNEPNEEPFGGINLNYTEETSLTFYTPINPISCVNFTPKQKCGVGSAIALPAAADIIGWSLYGANILSMGPAIAITVFSALIFCGAGVYVCHVNEEHRSNAYDVS